MNILFIANRLPYPPYRGDKLKIFNLAKQLSTRHNIHLLTFVENKNEYKYIENLLPYFSEINTVYLSKFKSSVRCLTKIFSSKPMQIYYFQSEEFKKKLKEIIDTNRFDVIHTQHLRMSQYSHSIENIPNVLDLPDAYSLYWKRRSLLKGNFLKSWFGRAEYRKVLTYEEIIRDFDLTLVCSEEDRILLSGKLKYDRIRILANGIDLTEFGSYKADYNSENRIIFTGNMNYFPNSDAAIYFSKEIFPEILLRNPLAKFYIVGQSPPKKVLSLQSENIIVTGFVESIGHEYSISSVAVSPVRVGAGTLNKVLEPMAIGVPVVSSSIGFEGIGATSGKEILLANSKDEFVNHVCNLLNDRNLRKYIGENGKRLVTNNFGWENISKQLESYFFHLCKFNKQDILGDESLKGAS